MQNTLADRLNQIIAEQKITKREFARRIGVGETHIYIITSGGRKNCLNQNISPSLARVIGNEFGYDPEWILHGNHGGDKSQQLRRSVLEQVEHLGESELHALQNFLLQLKK